MVRIVRSVSEFRAAAATTRGDLPVKAASVGAAGKSKPSGTYYRGGGYRVFGVGTGRPIFFRRDIFSNSVIIQMILQKLILQFL